ncbi:MAG: caspase family protein [Jaaginema sp. PMC 1079.18]|nr:caspase family protein [Jaaginema sp. PMC 1080.18]MEC4851591.1 caspase family protein [Jaaginema sp. PMC 1079.18]MEC4864838.1 caspase family protein [Jaaginema sp. PMC 1078.18]
MKRRHFVQFAGSTLATIGLSQTRFLQQSQQYGRVLAQNTPRKLALLVGINEYPRSDRFFPLYGCANDVELQKNLLIARFGFNPADIVTLTDTQASRDNIIETFQEHLIKQAQTGDVVVFHFSGHGSEVIDPSPLDPNYPYNSTFVPADDRATETGVVRDIMGQTLFLLLYALGQKTENVTSVLDSCHSGGGIRGEVRVRSAQAGKRASDAEFALQEQLLSQIGWTPAQFQERREEGIAAGVAIASAQRSQLAADYRFEDFYAGAFSFLLTQYLWQETGEVSEAISLLQERIEPLNNKQTPLYETAPQAPDSNTVYFTNPIKSAAQAVILNVSQNEATVWLGGIDPNNLEAFSPGALLSPVNNTNNTRGSQQLQLLERNGLTAKVALPSNLPPGTLLQETARVIPPDWRLGIGIDPTLDSETATIQEGLQALERIDAIPAQNAARPYPEKVHYILSRMSEAYQEQLRAENRDEILPVGSIGLFSPALEVVPKSFGSVRENVESAIARLTPKLRSLLAARVIKLTLNAESSTLAVNATMNLENRGNQILGTAFTVRGCNRPKECKAGTSRNPQVALSVGNQFFFNVENNENQALYLSVLAIDSSGEITVLFPNQFQESLSEAELQASTQIPPRSKIKIPDRDRGDVFTLIGEEAGTGEVLILLSPQPMTTALSRLQELSRARGEQAQGPVVLSNPLAVVNDVLGDVGTRGSGIRGGSDGQIAATSLAALSISFAVVEQT